MPVPLPLRRGLFVEPLLVITLFCALIALSPLFLLIVFPASYLLLRSRCFRNLGFETGPSARMDLCAVYSGLSGSEEKVRLVRRARPKIAPGTYIIRVEACGINPVDIKGVLGDKFPKKCMPWCFRLFRGNAVGFEFSGVVYESSGVGGADLPVGTAVFGFNYQYFPIGLGRLGGTACEYIRVNADQVCRKPATLAFQEAACLPLVGVTTLQAFEQHSLAAGQRLLVIGASGGVGHVATQVAAAMGVHVVGVCSARMAAAVRGYGAAEIIEYDGDVDVLEQLRQLVLGCGSGRNDDDDDGDGGNGDSDDNDDNDDKKGNASQFDMVLDCVSCNMGETGYISRILGASPSLLTPLALERHNYVSLGGQPWSWWRAAVKRLLKQQIFPPGYELFWIRMPGTQQLLRRLCLLCEGKEGLRPVVSHLHPFTDDGLAAAFGSIAPGGRVCVDLKTRSGERRPKEE